MLLHKLKTTLNRHYGCALGCFLRSYALRERYNLSRSYARRSCTCCELVLCERTPLALSVLCESKSVVGSVRSCLERIAVYTLLVPVRILRIILLEVFGKPLVATVLLVCTLKTDKVAEEESLVVRCEDYGLHI